MIRAWNEAAHWLDLSVYRFKFRTDQAPRPALLTALLLSYSYLSQRRKLATQKVVES